MVSCFSTKMPGQFKGERRVSSTNDSGTTGYYMQKNEGGLLPHTTYKIQLKMEQWYKYESHNSHIFKNLFLAVQGLCCSDRALSSCSARASHCSGFSCWGAQALGIRDSVAVVHRISCPAACGIFPDQGLKYNILKEKWGLPWWSSGKDSVLSMWGPRFNPWSLARGKTKTLQVT